jgi:hypothetical protein
MMDGGVGIDEVETTQKREAIANPGDGDCGQEDGERALISRQGEETQRKRVRRRPVAVERARSEIRIPVGEFSRIIQ